MIGLFLTAAVTVAPPPTTVSGGAVLDGKPAGLTVADPPGRVPAGSPRPVWQGLEEIARTANRRLTLSTDGRRVGFAPGPALPSAVAGPFRLAVRGVTCRLDPDAGPAVCEVALDLHWEPRLAVVRVADASGGKQATTAARMATVARLTGIPRTQQFASPIEIVYTITAAAGRVRFTVPDLERAKPQTAGGVSLTPRLPRRLDRFIELRLDLTYPEGHPEFESYESWTAGNVARLVHRDGRSLEPAFDEDARGRSVAVTYRLPAAAVGDLAGWSLVLDTPGPLGEFPVRFRLVDVPLP